MSTRARGPAGPTLGAKAVESGGLRYGARESALRPPLTTATQTTPYQTTTLFVLRIPKSTLSNPRSLDRSIRPKHHRCDPRKRALGGRHQIGIPAGFKSESVAGFLLECVAGFVGIRRES